MNTWTQLLPFIEALIFLAILVGIYRYATGSWNVLGLAMGADGLYSTSKMQWLLWTIAALLAYVAILFAALTKTWPAQVGSIGIPGNLIAAMGISLIGAVAAKAITQQQINRGLIFKREAPPRRTASGNTPPRGMRSDGSYPNGMAALFNNDDNQPDLVKAQLMMWTLVALLVYLIHTANTVLFILGQEELGNLSLPDIDPVLLALTGLGQGGYLATKLVSTTTPRLTGIQGQLTPGGEVVLHGIGLGNQPLGSQIVLWADGQRQPLAPLTENLQGSNVRGPGGLAEELDDKKLRVRFPGRQANGLPWRPGQNIEIGLEVAGKPIDRILSSTVQVPVLHSVQPLRARPGDRIRLTGGGFGPYAPGNQVLLGNFPVVVEQGNWNDAEIEVTIPQSAPENSWRPQPKEEIALGIQRNGETTRWDSPKLRLDCPPILFPPDESSCASPGKQMVLHGSGFGELLETNYLVISDESYGRDDLTDLHWSNEEIRFHFPDSLSERLSHRVTFNIQVHTDGKQSAPQSFLFVKLNASKESA